jgi:large subunit ribosomal protein L21e
MSKVRRKFRKKPRERGKSPLTKYLQKFEVNELASIVIESSVHKGRPHQRFHGLTGRIVGKQGRCYILKIRDGAKYKNIISAPVHLKKIQG